MSQSNTGNGLKNYFKQIKSLFPHYGKLEKRFMQDFKISVNEYIASNSDADMTEILSDFGSPLSIVQDYLNDVDVDYLLAQIKKTAYLKKTIVVLVVLVLISIGIKAGFDYKSYLEGKDAYLHEKVTILEEY